MTEIDQKNYHVNYPRLMISGDHGSAGKTTVTLGMLAYFRENGLGVSPFKKGPDFIDPMWLARAAEAECRNLDFFIAKDRIRTTFASQAQRADLSIIEGNKGLFDGVDTEGSDSSSALARLLEAPVLLVVDTAKMSRGIAPLVQGYLNFEPDLQIEGIILNNVAGARHESKLRAAIEYYTTARVLGAIPRDREGLIRERHLGLVPAGESELTDHVIEQNRRMVAENVNMDEVLRIARAVEVPSFARQEARNISEDHAESFAERGALNRESSGEEARSGADAGGKTVRIGVARDKAFCFYYPENLEALQENGAELVEFSPLEDDELPAVDGLYLGGGFPEEFAEALSSNDSMLHSVKEFTRRGKPVYAECGGLMYLSQSIQKGEERYPMVGVLHFDTEMQKKPVGRGYVVLSTESDHATSIWRIPAGEEIRAHEFHHSRPLQLQGESESFVYSVKRGYGINGQRDGIIQGSVFASYAHLHAYAASWWAPAFVRAVSLAETAIVVNSA